MRTTPVVGMVLALGFSLVLMSASGIGPAVFGVDSSDAPAAETLGEIADESSVDEDKEGGGFSGDASGDNEPTLVGFGISMATYVTKLVGAVALLPGTLMRLGFPAYFALPAGGLAQIIAFIGLAQAASGREYL